MTTVEKILQHFGVKGMKWGVRRPVGPTGVVVTERPGGRLKTSGGANQPASEDARKAAILGQKARKSTPNALSNQELQSLVTRLNLERQYTTLAPKTPSQQVKKFLADTLLGVGKQEASKLAANAAAQQVSKVLKR